MKEKVIECYNGRFVYDQPGLKTEPEELVLELKPGETAEGSFVVSSMDERRVKGLLHTRIPGMTLRGDSFFARAARVEYSCRPRCLREGEELEGAIWLETSAGEYALPVKVRVQGAAAEEEADEELPVILAGEAELPVQKAGPGRSGEHRKERELLSLGAEFQRVLEEERGGNLSGQEADGRFRKLVDRMAELQPESALCPLADAWVMLREDRSYTDLEARVLDVALVLHADHGGGNNSTFTNHVVTSSGTDTYSAIAAAMASLKGPRHGGANSKVMDMMADIKAHVEDWGDQGAVEAYLTRILDKDAFDGSGLIYGLGHAVYTRSDPRCEVFRSYVQQLAAEKDRGADLALYESVERIGKRLLMERRGKKAISTNIDFYSGLVYEMLGLPMELYTPLFAVARIAGWSAHRMEELSAGGKLIRPRYECVEAHRPYVPMEERQGGFSPPSAD